MASSPRLADRTEPAESPLRNKVAGIAHTAFRYEPGRRFVLYMGDDEAGDGVCKFVSHRVFGGRERPSDHKTLEAGQLFIAHWEPEARGTFAGAGAPEGRGIWVSVPRSALEHTATELRELFGAEEYDRHFATDRLKDINVAGDGCVYISFTRDGHDSVRCLRERGDDPGALAFSWRDYAARSSSRSASARSLNSVTDASLMSS